MAIEKVWSVYFSATGTTKLVAEKLGAVLADCLGKPQASFDFTLPGARQTIRHFMPDDVVVFGVPVIAGRVPNVLLKYLSTFDGGQALAIPVVVYGNRNYDDALIELRDILEKVGFHTFAAGAFIGEHSFSRILAAGRPDAADAAVVERLARQAAEKIISGNVDCSAPVTVKGTPYPYRGYYWPRDRQGKPVDIRKVKPLTNDNCNDCKLCAEICPLGSINKENVREYIGICMKCGACIKRCPQGAKYYADEGYLYHQHELEAGFSRRAEPELFI